MFMTVFVAACAGSGGGPKPTGSGAPPTQTATAGAPTATQSPASAATATPPLASPPDGGLPVGFPLDPALRTDAVTGPVGQRTLVAGGGPAVRDASAGQASSDAEAANASGWDCRVHREYEGAPAVDWYVQGGQPVRATMDGEALLQINTVVNAFEYYGTSREPYLGNPDRSRAPRAPFPGPGGGMGLYVSVVSSAFRTDYGHLDTASTVAAVPASAFVGGFSAADDFAKDYAVPRASTVANLVARWPVRRGDVIGFTGDSGYSEAPHLHYQILRLTPRAQLCPTGEPGFEDGGWLFRLGRGVRSGLVYDAAA